MLSAGGGPQLEGNPRNSPACFRNVKRCPYCEQLRAWSARPWDVKIRLRVRSVDASVMGTWHTGLEPRSQRDDPGHGKVVGRKARVRH